MRRNCFLLTLLVVFIGSCKQKKPSLSGDDPVKINDFIDFFQPLGRPFQIDDNELKKKPNDSLLISYKNFTLFVPDSLLSKVYGKKVKPKIYAVGKVVEPKKESYLIVKTIYGEKRTVFVICFDSKEKYIAGMSILEADKNSLTLQSAGIDRRFSIYKMVQRMNADGSVNEGKDVYILNVEAKNFMLILTDPLDKKPPELINPIDTLSRKNKFSADYASGKTNLVSIRDGRRAGRLLFFIHIEKNNRECTGELKGEAIMKSSNMAEYHANGNLCALQFTFTSSSVSVKEIEACGTYRGVRCLFDGTFPKKKVAKLKPNIKGKISKQVNK